MKIKVELKTYDYSSLNLGKFNGKIIRKNNEIINGYNFLDFTIEDNDKFILSLKKDKGYIKELYLINTNWEKETENFNRWYERYYIKNDNNRFFVLSRDKDSSDWTLYETHRSGIFNYIDSPMNGNCLELQKYIKVIMILRIIITILTIYNFDFLLNFYSHTPETAVISENKDYIDLRLTYTGPYQICTLKDPIIRINKVHNNNWEYEIINPELKETLNNLDASGGFTSYIIKQKNKQCPT